MPLLSEDQKDKKDQNIRIPGSETTGMLGFVYYNPYPLIWLAFRAQRANLEKAGFEYQLKKTTQFLILSGHILMHSESESA